MKRILLIDDNPSGAVTRARVLAIHGYEVQIALDGGTGLALAEALQPDLVMLDHVLPDVDGREVNSRLHQLLPGVKVISLSGYDNVGEDYEPPADAVLIKGNGVKEMLRTIAELIG